MKRQLSRVTRFGWILVAATVAVAVALVFTRATGVLLVAAVICLAWIGVYLGTDPLRNVWSRKGAPEGSEEYWRDREL